MNNLSGRFVRRVCRIQQGARSWGVEELETNQFCRACGSNLTIVRAAIETPDKITQSAVLARSEVGKAFAAKIREADASNLPAIAENALPEIEKFLESSEKVSSNRSGSILASIGFEVAVAFSVLSFLLENDLIILAGFGLVTFFIGISFCLNGMFFTIPAKEIADNKDEADRQRSIDQTTQPRLNAYQGPDSKSRDFGSVVESTTRNLTKTGDD